MAAVGELGSKGVNTTRQSGMTCKASARNNEENFEYFIPTYKDLAGSRTT